MRNESRRRFLKHIMPAAGGWMIASRLAGISAFFASVKKASAQLAPSVMGRLRKTIIVPGASKIFRTRDGLTMSQTLLPLASAAEFSWADIAWNGSVYCAVGEGAAAATSTNLSSWTANQTPFRTGAKRIIAVGSTFTLLPYDVVDRIATSTNGSTWSTVTLPISDEWVDIVWNGSLYCIIASEGTNALTSPDGITWTARTLPVATTRMRVVWNGTTFCIANLDGTVTTSPDGVTWTTRVGNGVAGSNIGDAYASAGKIYLVDYSTTQIYLSIDSGLTFSTFGTPPTGGGLGIIVNGTTVVVASLGGGVRYSSNSGATWGYTPTFTSAANFGCLRYVNATYIEVGYQYSGGFNALSTSTNASTWTSRAMPAAYIEARIRGLAVTGSKMCAVTFTSTSTCFYSGDYGITWSSGTMPATHQWASIATNGSVFCALTGTASASAYTSADGGATWTARTLPANRVWGDIAWNGTLFCALSSGSASTIAATSPNGITWTLRTLPASEVWGRLIWSGSIFVALSKSSNSFATSPDGITWTLRSTPLGGSDICWTGTRFVTLKNSSVMTSPDGITWTAQANAPSSAGQLFGLAWNGSAVVAIGYTGSAVSHDQGVSWTAYERQGSTVYSINNVMGLPTVSQ